MTDPCQGIDVRILAFDICTANAWSFEPCSADRAVKSPRRSPLVLGLRRKRRYSETRQRFDKASQPLRRRIENPVHTHRIVEAISEGSVFLGIGLIRNWPCVAISADTEKRPRRPLRFKIHSNSLLTADEESSRRPHDLRRHGLQIVFPHEPKWDAVAEFRVQTG